MTQHLTQRPCSRRQSLALAAASLLPALSPSLARATAPGTSPAAMPAAPLPVEPLAAVAALERRVGGRLGVVVLDTGSGACVGHRADERFGMCSTFKLPLAALVLQQIDQGRWQADRWVPYTQADMTAHAPVTQAHLARGGMSVVALAQAAQTTSDNTAANLLLTLIGGPAGFTAAMRAAGDKVTRLDRLEPHMNLVKPGDERDTTTPVAMARTAAHWLTGDALSTASRALLIDWMVATRTGSKRLRAGLPAAWRAGDKTGTAMAEGMTDKYNDVAIIWPPGRVPVLISAYYETARAHGRMRDEDQAVLAEAGRRAARWVQGG
jgi:beta-lactamase class A